MNWMGGYRKPNRLSKKDKEKQDQFFLRMRFEKHMAGNRKPSATTPSIPTPADIFFASKMGSTLPHAGSSGISSFTSGSHIISERQQHLPLDHRRNAHPIPNNERQRQSLALSSDGGPNDALTKWCAVLQKDFKTNSNYCGEREKTRVGFNNKRPAYSSSLLQNQNMIESYPKSYEPKEQLAGNFSKYHDGFRNMNQSPQFSFNFNQTPKDNWNFISNHPEVAQPFECHGQLEEDNQIGFFEGNEQESVIITKECSENPFIEEVEMRRKTLTSKILTPPSSASSKGRYQPYIRKLECNEKSSPLQMGNIRNSGNEGFSTSPRKMPIQSSSQTPNSRSSQKLNEVCNTPVLEEKKPAVINLKNDLATQYQEWLMTKIMNELYFELPTESKQSSLGSTEDGSEVSSFEEYTQESNLNPSSEVTPLSEASGFSLRSQLKIVEITTVETSVQTDSKSSQMVKEVSVQTSFESPKPKKDFAETGIQYNEFEMASYFHPHKRIWYSV